MGGRISSDNLIVTRHENHDAKHLRHSPNGFSHSRGIQKHSPNMDRLRILTNSGDDKKLCNKKIVIIKWHALPVLLLLSS